ncbi:hypothetical protein PPERSA_06276 [Pseudocohnilembus persalinus]|uniref:Transmembrane protein n=1 Tax=Pseudocohnilembus persalinus TaxID=266149 RepID=A0A0V0QVU4_PSEPJ|nr:hypothetical protein PPERSA_06276 [Pseudocohnilembus persalinus]|eukprot:KRX06305.1 hypothetical protein PPERSA_06276 [Pseudocohnilembus persalinus]
MKQEKKTNLYKTPIAFSDSPLENMKKIRVENEPNILLSNKKVTQIQESLEYQKKDNFVDIQNNYNPNLKVSSYIEQQSSTQNESSKNFSYKVKSNLYPQFKPQQDQNNQKENLTLFQKLQKLAEKLFIYKLFLHCIFHYVDFVTDIMVIQQIYHIAMTSKSEVIKNAWLEIFQFMILILFIERILSFKYILETIQERNLFKNLQKYNKENLSQSQQNQKKYQQQTQNLYISQKIYQKQQQQNESLNETEKNIINWLQPKLKDYLISALITFTYADFFYIALYRFENKQSNRSVIRKQIVERVLMPHYIR